MYGSQGAPVPSPSCPSEPGHLQAHGTRKRGRRGLQPGGGEGGGREQPPQQGKPRRTPSPRVTRGPGLHSTFTGKHFHCQVDQGGGKWGRSFFILISKASVGPGREPRGVCPPWDGEKPPRKYGCGAGPTWVCEQGHALGQRCCMLGTKACDRGGQIGPGPSAGHGSVDFSAGQFFRPSPGDGGEELPGGTPFS